MTGLRILCFDDGPLPAVVCLHDAGGHARRFERLARVLEERRRVVAYDLRGHGRSPWAGGQTVGDHADDLQSVLERLGIDQTALVGEGFGCWPAIEFAATAGDRVTALVLLDPPLSLPAAAIRELAERQRAAPSYERVDDAIEALRDDVVPVHTPQALLEEEMAEHLVADEDGRMRPRVSRAAVAEFLDEAAESPPRLRDVVCPTLIVRGADSHALSEADAEAAAGELRRGAVATVPGGHPVLWDALAETGAVVRDFVLARTPA